MKPPRKLFLGMVLAWAVLLPQSLLRAAGLASQHRIQDHGHADTFVIATDELQIVGKPHPEKILPAASAEAARAQADVLSRAVGKEVRLVLYPLGSPRTEFSRRILSSHVLVQIEPGVDVLGLARAHGAALARAFPHLPRHYLLAATGTAGALALAENLRGQPGVISAEPQLASLPQKKSLPNDTLFPLQWHLRNTGQSGGQPGIDINVTNVWNDFRGSNIYIAIIDDGLQFTHPDLAPNAALALNYDFNGVDGHTHDSDPSPNLTNDFHGTCVAGLAAARGNNSIGVCGAAYEAQLVGLRLIALPAEDVDFQDAMLHSNSIIQIKNNSYGAEDCPFSGTALDGPGPLMKAALGQGVAAGRNGKGVIYTFAAGNGLFDCGEDANYDGYANAIEVVAVGAVNYRGVQAYYSEPGACLVVAAPGGDANEWITSTDLVGANGYNPPHPNEPADLSDLNYTKSFDGTSAATPLVSGVIALVLQANPNLNYRDVKEILLRSATKVQPSDSDWKTNSAGVPHNHKFGGGLINAQAAVHLATNWAGLGPLTNFSLLQTNLNASIPDNSPGGITNVFVVTNKNFRVEHVTLTMTAPHTNWGDLVVTLISPGGMQSRLATVHPSVNRSKGYEAWTFSSVRHWGERADGTWTVKIADGSVFYTGFLNALELKLYGTTPAAQLTVSSTNQSALLALQAAAPGWKYALDASTEPVSSWAQIATLTIPSTGSTNFTDFNALGMMARRFYRARLLP